jgi:ABC-type uncharacterized transport system involved in gliding motility auxiliary subunit
MSSKNNSSFIIFFVALVGVLVLANVLSTRGFLRLDLTKEGKYTLSKASVETVKSLADTLTVSAYFTEDLPPPYAQHARYVNDLLEEYLAASAGKFAYEFVDPAKLETTEDKLQKKDVQRDIFGRLSREATSVEKELSSLGVAPVEIRVFADDQQKTQRAYMGIVLRYQDKTQVIPVVQNLGELEKSMTSLMRKLTRDKEPVLGILRGAQSPNIEKLSSALKQNVTIKDYVDVSNNGQIPEEVDALLIFGSGEHFGEHGAEKIHKFIRSGKSAAFFIDRYQIDPQSFSAKPYGPRSKTHEILDLLKAYGLEITDAMVADAACASINLQEQRGSFSFSLPVKYPFVPELMNLSFESAITKGISGVFLPFVSSIVVTPIDGLKTENVALSSKSSWLEKDPIDINPRRDWNKADIKPDGPHVLMVEARGLLPDVNKEGDQSVAAETRLVVVGSSAPLWDEFIGNANMALALNMVDWLVADSALLEMRSKTFQDLPLNTEISDTTRQAVKYGNILGVPLLLVLYGLLRWRIRESRRANIQNRMAAAGGKI